MGTEEKGANTIDVPIDLEPELDPETLLDLVYTWTESWRPGMTKEDKTSPK
jgi:hypothetical protein